MSATFTLGVPSKGRLKDEALAIFARAGFALTLEDRGYRATIAALPQAQITLMPATEIAERLCPGTLDAGITGMDVLHEMLGTPVGAALPEPAMLDGGIVRVARLGFGAALLVVAVPNGWLDVTTMEDLAEVADGFRRQHGRHLRVATKYPRLTRAHFSRHGVVDYRIVSSTGATEAAPSSGAADLIVDITTTGATLAANRLTILADGKILASEASLFAGAALMACTNEAGTAFAQLAKALLAGVMRA